MPDHWAAWCEAAGGRVATLTNTALAIDAGGSSLFVVLNNAKFDDTPQIFFRPDLSRYYQVNGISISLGNHDWLFFSDAPVPNVALLQRHGN